MKHHPLAGIALAISGCFLFSVVDTASQVVVRAGVAVILAVWVRYLLQAVSTAALAASTRGRAAMWRTRRLGLQLLRGATLVTGSCFLFASLKFITVGEMTAIMMLAPLTVTACAGLIFKEHVPPLRWLLVLGGFAGTMVIIRPGGEDFSWALLLPLGQVACNTVFQLITSRLAHTEDPVTTNLYTSATGTLITLPVLAFVDLSLVPGWAWAVMIGMGLVATVGHMVWAMAFQRVPATQIMPFTYVQIAFAVFAGWVATGAVPDRWAVVGMGMIALCGVGSALLTLKERRG